MLRAVTADIDRLNFCRQLAEQAGRMAHTGFGTTPMSLKGRHDEVTAMDSAVERHIRQALNARFPDDAVIGEEEGRAGGSPDAAHVWIVDPIDGTANYARGIAHYCVSIGLLRAGRPVLGVLHDPSHDRLYWAAEGQGAWMNGQRLAVSPCADVAAAIVECGWSTRRSTADYLAMVARVMAAGAQMRRAGSGALGLADVAAGRVEAYCELHINAWDCLAGIVLVREAGGMTNDFFTEGAVAGGNVLVATNRAIGSALADVIGIAPLDAT